MKTKPFDLQKALAGHSVVTRDGRKIIRIAHFPEAAEYPVSALIDKEDRAFTFTKSGGYHWYAEDYRDLFLEVKSVTRWARITRYIPSGRIYFRPDYTSKREAEISEEGAFEVLPAYEYEAEE